MLLRCLKCDFKRVAERGRLARYIAVMTLFILLLFVSDDAFGADLPVLYYVVYVTSMHSFLIVFPIAFLIYGTCLIEDREEDYYRQSYLKVPIFKYVISKSLVNLVVSVFSIFFSVALASIILGFLKKWNVNIDAVSFLSNTDVGSLYDSGKLLSCVLYIGLQLGLLSGLLSSIAFFMSSFVKDKIFAAVMTFVGCMVIQYAWSFFDEKGVSFLGHFIISASAGNGEHWLFKDFVMMIVACLISTFLTWIILRRKVQFE